VEGCTLPAKALHFHELLRHVPHLFLVSEDLAVVSPRVVALPGCAGSSGILAFVVRMPARHVLPGINALACRENRETRHTSSPRRPFHVQARAATILRGSRTIGAARAFLRRERKVYGCCLDAPERRNPRRRRFHRFANRPWNRCTHTQPREPKKLPRQNNMTQVLTAKQFNELTSKNGWKWVKLTKENECHNGFQFTTGLNTDTKEFKADVDCDNGLYFCRDTDVHVWAPCHTFVRDVTIPDDSPCAVVVADSKRKAKVHAFVLGDKKDLWDKDLCEAVVRKHIEDFRFVPEGKRTLEICKLAVQQKGRALKHVPEDKQIDEIFELAVQSDGRALVYVPKDKRTDGICRIAIQQDGWALVYVPREKQTVELCELAVRQNGWALHHVPLEQRTVEVCELAVRQNGSALYYVPREKQTVEVCELAVRQNGSALYYVPREKQTVELYELAVQHDGFALQYIPPEKQTDEMCDTAVRQDGHALQFVPREKQTEEMYKLAVQQNGSALRLIPREKRTPEICELAEAQLRSQRLR